MQCCKRQKLSKALYVSSHHRIALILSKRQQCNGGIFFGDFSNIRKSSSQRFRQLAATTSCPSRWEKVERDPGKNLQA